MIRSKDDILQAMQGRFADFYGQFTELRMQHGDLRGACPLHNGDGSNFAVNPETGEWFCHSQCQAGGDALEFLKRRGQKFGDALLTLAAFAGLPLLHDLSNGVSSTQIAMKSSRKPPARLIQTYDYMDAEGVLLYQVCRMEPKDFRQRRPDGQGGWIWNLGDVPRVLYNLPAVMKQVAPGKMVFIVEGEKDADTLSTLYLCATTNSGGAEKWQESFSDAMAGANVVLLPDNDAPGLRHMEAIAASLTGKASRVRLLKLPDLPPKGDISDWLQAGGTNEQLAALVKAAPDWVPNKEIPKETPSVKPTAPMARKPLAERIISLRDVPPPPSELPHLFGPYLNIGAAHWLTGQTGIGKSTLLYNLLPALAEGQELWGIECKPQRILYVDMESGDVGRSLKVQRLFRDRERPDGLLFAREPIRLPDELLELLSYLKAQGVSLVVFDTARRCFTVKDENDNAEVYNRVVPTLDALKAAGVATLTMGHPPKNGATGARGAGAQEDAGDINLTLTMYRGELTDKDGILALRVTKNRLLGLAIPDLILRRIGDDQFERVEGAEAATETPSALLRCRLDIVEFLSDQPNRRARHTEIITAMKARGHSESTAKRTRVMMLEQGDIQSADSGGYVLTDPFEDM